jgi:ElaB/YqjD/DUF883 family membrane-anchored ribosome-binding protein
MKNRVADHLPSPRHVQQPTLLDLPKIGQGIQREFAERASQVETYVQQHPVTGIGAAFCIGLFAGWIIKRR